MRDEPTGEQLLATAEAVFRDRILPSLSSELKTDALMIARTMGIAARQLREGERPEQEELESLQGLVGPLDDGHADLRARLLVANRQLCALIRRGESDGGKAREEILTHLRRVTRHKLLESNPKMLGRS